MTLINKQKTNEKGQFVKGMTPWNKRPEAQRFWEKVDKSGEGGCWLWIAQLSPDGYGRFTHNGGALAHRFAWVEKHGAVPRGMQLDHLCRTRNCVNPDHLELVSNQMNTQRGALAKLSPEKVKEIHKLLGKIEGTKIAEMFGVTPTLISKISKGEAWNNVAAPHELKSFDRKKPVAKYSLDGKLLATYPGCAEAEKAEGIPLGYVSACCTGRIKSTRGHRWKFIDKTN